VKARYYLDFDDVTGTVPVIAGETATFVTFRLRGTWAKRLKKRDIVYLASTKSKQVYAKAKVTFVQKGPARFILASYAPQSHLEIGQDLGPEWLASVRRYESMRKRYGPHKFSNDSIITAIGLCVKE
jgi:hypothetical protein